MSAVSNDAVLSVNQVATSAGELPAPIFNAPTIGDGGLLNFDESVGAAPEAGNLVPNTGFLNFNEGVGAAPEAGNLVPNTGAGNGSGDPLITCTVAAAPIGEQRVEAGDSDMLHGLG